MSRLPHWPWRKGLRLLPAGLLCLSLGPAGLAAVPRLKVSENQRFLVKEDGSPFFYLADTAWELFHRLNREEADLYLANRAAKGFTVIQAVALAELDGLGVPNPYGHLPLEDLDPGKPNEAYFQHVDYVINKAEELGMYTGLLPTWGDKWNRKWGIGPEIFTPENAAAYGQWLGRRYRDKPVIWILGGDRNPENAAHFEILRAMAAGLRKVHRGSQLMTFHPMGSGNSAKWFHHDDWLDFHLFQSGHRDTNLPNYNLTLANHRLDPPKPTLDGEPRYEDHPVGFKPEQGWFDDYDVRQAAYWSMLAGACGHTYGNHNIWQFWQADRRPVSSARTPWRQALGSPGSFQMKHLRSLFEAYPWPQLVPDQSVIAGDAGKGGDHQRAARSEDGTFGFVYTPAGRPVTAQMNKFTPRRVRAHWYDPRTGKAVPLGDFRNMETQAFEPPAQGRGQDWVLVLDDPRERFRLPLQPTPFASPEKRTEPE
jgi:hypothetical protein